MKQGVFLRAMAANADEAIIDIVGVIGWEVAYQQMRDMLRGLPSGIKRVVFDIYSPGGDVWEGNAIVQEIGELGKKVETVARVQVAASMATLIAAACNKRSIASNGRWLIHNAWTQTQGDAAAHEKAAQTLRDAENEAAKFYASRTGGKAEDMLALMAQERWLMPEETKALGFVQEICDPFKDEDYAQVRQEIVAAGKWPQALVELPPVESKEVPHGNQTAQGADVVAPVVAQPAAIPTDADVTDQELDRLEAAYESGKADGLAEGSAKALADLMPQIEQWKAKLAAAESEASKHQSAHDKLVARIAALEAAHEARMQAVRSQLDEASSRLRQFVSGSLNFTPAVETWADAMRETGDYEKARAKYPQLFDVYLAAERQKGRK